MKDTKTFEIRDGATCIPAVAIRTDDSPVFRRASLGVGRVLLIDLNAPAVQDEPRKWWLGRTLKLAHRFIESTWDILVDGQVVDVQYILGETTEPKASELTGAR